MVRRQQGGHDDQVEDVEEEQLQARRDEYVLHRPASGRRRLQVEGAGAELAHGSQEHHCERGEEGGGAVDDISQRFGFSVIFPHCCFVFTFI